MILTYICYDFDRIENDSFIDHKDMNIKSENNDGFIDNSNIYYYLDRIENDYYIDYVDMNILSVRMMIITIFFMILIEYLK